MHIRRNQSVRRDHKPRAHPGHFAVAPGRLDGHQRRSHFFCQFRRPRDRGIRLLRSSGQASTASRGEIRRIMRACSLTRTGCHRENFPRPIRAEYPVHLTSSFFAPPHLPRPIPPRIGARPSAVEAIFTMEDFPIVEFGLAGLGNVGAGVFKNLQKNGDLVASRSGIRLKAQADRGARCGETRRHRHSRGTAHHRLARTRQRSGHQSDRGTHRRHHRSLRSG